MAKSSKNGCSFSAVILAAGNGLRYGKKKQFELLSGKEVWRWARDTIGPLVDEIVVVGIDIPGGETRQESVKIGVNHVSGKYVIVHDAARPLVTTKQIKDLKSALLEGHKMVGFYMPVVDAIYHDEYGHMDKTQLKLLQDPQGFERELLVNALNEADRTDFPSNCELIKEVYGINLHLLLGGENLKKITFREDIPVLETLLKNLKSLSEHRGHIEKTAPKSQDI